MLYNDVVYSAFDRTLTCYTEVIVDFLLEVASIEMIWLTRKKIITFQSLKGQVW